jgi:hypothetical protein
MNGQCVPDGSVVCDQGTVFDMSTGTCVVDPSACAAGTVFVEGECVPEDETLTADHEEATEPNDASGAGQFDAPALDGMTSIHGCITPRAGARDQDPWIINASGPTALEITADGVGGLAAAFIVVELSGNPGLETYARVGVNLTGDTSRRQVFLPVAGSYVLVMDDTRALMTGAPTGSGSTCYFTTIKTIPLPTATALTLPQTTGTDSGNLRVLSYQADQVADILDVTMTTTSSQLFSAFVVMKNGQFLMATDTSTIDPPFATLGGLETTDMITVVIDNEQNIAIDPQPYALDVLDIAAQPLPTDGSTVTATKKNGQLPDTPWYEPNFFYFDVTTANQIVRFDTTPSDTVVMWISRTNLFTLDGGGDVFATIDTGSGLDDFSGEYMRFAQPGRYYFVMLDPAGTGGDTYMVTSTLTNESTSALTYGTAATAQPLPAGGSAFHTIDITAAQTWIAASVPAAADWGIGDAHVTFYDLSGEGWLDNTYPELQSRTLLTDGSEAMGRITQGEGVDFLVRVENTDTPGTTPTYDLLIGDRSFNALGAITPGTPINRTGDPVLADTFGSGNPDATRFLVTGQAGASVSTTVTPTGTENSDLIIRRLNRNETSAASADVGFDGDPETLAGMTFGAAPNDWIAFTVGSWDDEDSTFDMDVTSLPPPYTSTTGTLPFADICAGGTTVMTGADDSLSATITLPAAFAAVPFFGAATTGEIMISSNGWFTFDTATTTSGGNNGAIPSSSAPNAMVAPYWEDLVGMTVCTQANGAGDVFTIQWTGTLYNVAAETAQFQAVLRTDGSMDFIYGPNHRLDGSELDSFFGVDGATVGVENAAGTQAFVVLFDQAGLAPSTSRTLTPN